MEVGGQFHAPPDLPLGKQHRVSVGSVGLYNLNAIPLPRMETRAARIPADLFRLPEGSSNFIQYLYLLRSKGTSVLPW
jgi:hypothetical protein